LSRKSVFDNSESSSIVQIAKVYMPIVEEIFLMQDGVALESLGLYMVRGDNV